jgi:hypothetical protein
MLKLCIAKSPCILRMTITVFQRLARKGMDGTEQCLLCDQHLETINHLLTSCVFARQFWAALLQPVGMLQLVPQPADGVFEDLVVCLLSCSGAAQKRLQLSSHPRCVGHLET